VSLRQGSDREVVDVAAVAVRGDYGFYSAESVGSSASQVLGVEIFDAGFKAKKILIGEEGHPGNLGGRWRGCRISREEVCS